jgi:hypothetical protein
LILHTLLKTKFYHFQHIAILFSSHIITIFRKNDCYIGYKKMHSKKQWPVMKRQLNQRFLKSIVESKETNE